MKAHSLVETMPLENSSKGYCLQQVLQICIRLTTQAKPIHKGFILVMTNMEATCSLIFKEEPMIKQMQIFWCLATVDKLFDETASLQYERKWYGYHLS